MDTKEISILIVSYNTSEMTLACLRSVFEQTRETRFEVIVVDNASTDGSAEAVAAEFAQVKLIRADTNLGFAAANKLAARHAVGEYLLLLNPDTVVLDRALEKLLAFARANMEVGIVGGRTLYADGTLNPTSCWSAPSLWSTCSRALGLAWIFHGSRLFDPEGMGYWQRDSVREVDIVTGCLLMIRHDLWEQLGGFDPAFFMYGEEFDLCMRAGKLGRKCLINPEATIIHYGSASESVRADKMVRLLKAKAQLFRKHWRPAAAWCGIQMLRFWAFSRMAVGATVLRRDADAYDAWQCIWRRRGEWCKP